MIGIKGMIADGMQSIPSVGTTCANQRQVSSQPLIDCNTDNVELQYKLRVLDGLAVTIRPDGKNGVLLVV